MRNLGLLCWKKQDSMLDYWRMGSWARRIEEKVVRVDTPSKRNRERELEARGFFYFFCWQPFDKARFRQGNPRKCKGFSLVFLAFPLKQIACRLYLRGSDGLTRRSVRPRRSRCR